MPPETQYQIIQNSCLKSKSFLYRVWWGLLLNTVKNDKPMEKWPIGEEREREREPLALYICRALTELLTDLLWNRLTWESITWVPFSLEENINRKQLSAFVNSTFLVVIPSAIVPTRSIGCLAEPVLRSSPLHYPQLHN